MVRRMCLCEARCIPPELILIILFMCYGSHNPMMTKMYTMFMAEKSLLSGFTSNTLIQRKQSVCVFHADLF